MSGYEEGCARAARRPTTACRAAIYAALVPAPSTDKERDAAKSFVTKLAAFKPDPAVLEEASDHIRQSSSRAHPQLVQGQQAVQQRHCRGPEPEMESDGEKSIRIPHLQCPPNRFIPSTRRPTRATIHPRILLTSQTYKSPGYRISEYPGLDRSRDWGRHLPGGEK